MAVHHYARHAADAMLSRPCGDVVLVHVQHFDVVIRSGNAPHDINRFPTGVTTGAKHLDLLPLRHIHPPFGSISA
jgi:hypothetical protein